MSRGLGATQRAILALLDARQGASVITPDVARGVFGREQLTRSEETAIRRALRTLEARRLIARAEQRSCPEPRKHFCCWRLATATRAASRPVSVVTRSKKKTESASAPREAR